MNKKILILGLSVGIILVCAYIGFLVFKSNEKKPEQKIDTKEYTCLYETRSQDGDVNLGRYTYNVVVNKENDSVIKETLTAEKHYNKYDLFYEDYSRYNTTNEVEYKLVAYDFDTKMLVLQKESEPNMSYSEYIEMRPFDASSCKEKTESAEVTETKVSDSDKRYLCKKDNNAFYFTVDNFDKITSAKSGSIHKMNSLEEFNQRASVLKSNDTVLYLFDRDNLIITQLVTFNGYGNITYNEYIITNLSDYDCNLME